MLTSAKAKIFDLARRTGVMARIRDSRWRTRRLLVLGYHSVSLDDEHHWSPTYSMTVPVLEKRLGILKRHRYSVLPLLEALDLVRSGGLPERAVALTFDDGLYDFQAQAYPVLKSFGFPATVFLPTCYCRFNRPVFDCVCSYLLWKGRGARLCLAPVLGRGNESVDLANEAARSHALRLIMDTAKTLTIEERDHVARKVATGVGVDYDELCSRRILHLLAPAEVRALSEAGVDFQMHTHAHCMPPDRDCLAREVERNRAEITSMTGRRPVHLCYPSGVHSPAFLPWLKELGVSSASTCQPGLVGPSANPLLIPRFIDTAVSPDLMFEGWLSGLAHVLPRRTIAPSASPQYAAPGSHS